MGGMRSIGRAGGMEGSAEKTILLISPSSNASGSEEAWKIVLLGLDFGGSLG